MDFDLYSATIYRAIKRQKLLDFFLVKFLRGLFLGLLVLSLLLEMLSFSGFTSGYSAAKMFALFLALYLLFMEICLFSEQKIKKPPASAGSENLADFLDFDSARIVESSIKFCRKKKIQNNSAALLYFIAKSGREVPVIFLRLGMDLEKIIHDLKNYLEKMPREQCVGLFSPDFIKIIQQAFDTAKSRKKSVIGPGEILVALAKQEEFFKKALLDCGLKPQDVENLTLWLDSAQVLRKRSRQFWSRENLSRQGSLGKDWSSGYTATLDRFSVDWRRIVSKWAFKEIIGHKKEIDQVETILAKTDGSNILLVGEQGSGRKSVVQALAQKCFLGQSLPQLNNRRVVEIDAVMLAAQVPDFEKLEAILDQIFAEVAASGNVILVLDEMENFVGQKTQKAGVFDVSGVLSKYLPMPNFKFIGITTFEGLHKNIESSRSFADLFERVEVEEVSEAEAVNIVQNAALELERKNKVLVLYPSVREAINLAARYMPSLAFPKKALDILQEAVVLAQKNREKVVLPHHIAEIVSKRTEIPLGKMQAKEKETLLNLENLIHQRIVNQEEAVREISIAMRRARSGIGPSKRPMGSFLFMGPTGVGKTETAKALAEIYFGSEQKMIRLDMSEFQQVQDVSRLIGAVSPVEVQGVLTTPVREAPFSLVLLDEIEKAHPNILNLFLQVLDEGRITDGQGRKVVFTNTIIICTSNAGADAIFKEVESGRQIEKTKFLNDLLGKSIFKPEFVNRFDATIIFNPLSRENLLQIAELSLRCLQKDLKEKEIDFEITESLKERIVELSYKPEFGAREMRRVIQDNVESAVAQALLQEKIHKGDRISIDPGTFELLTNYIDR